MALKKKKKKYFGNCGNPIADNVKKKFILTIVAIPLPKMEKKYIYILANCGNPIADNAKKKIMKYVNE